VLMASAWLFGLAMVVGAQALRQQAARARLHQRVGELHARLPAGCSPALVGAWRPRLALPDDFALRFDAAEQAAVLAHEACHQRRHDNRWNLLALALACLQWFNPLAWWALRRYRADQELACDAAVLHLAAPAARAAHLRALLKSDPLTAPLAVAVSSWRGTHPLVERVALLNQALPSSARRRAGATVVLSLALVGWVAAQGHQPTLGGAPAAVDTVMLYITVQHNERPLAAPRLFGKLGETMAVEMRPAATALSSAGAAPAWRLEVVPTVHEAGSIRLQMRHSAGVPLTEWASATLVTKDGETSRFEVTGPEGLHRFGFSLVARLAAAPDKQRNAN
jgi:BlaR1 peptidase M56